LSPPPLKPIETEIGSIYLVAEVMFLLQTLK